MNRELEDILKEKLYDSPTSERLPSWQQMERRLTLYANAHPEVRVAQRNTALRQVFYTAAAVIALVVGGSLLWHHNQRPVTTAALGTQTPSVVAPSAPTSTARPSGDADLGTLLKSARSIRVFNPTSTPKASLAAIMKDESTDANPLPDYAALSSSATAERNATNNRAADPSAIAASPSANALSTAQAIPGAQQTTTSKRAYPIEALLADNQHISRRKPRPWMVGAFADASTLSGVNPAATSPLMTSPPLNGDMTDIKQPNFTDLIPRDQLDHRMPLSAGLSVRKYLTPRLGIETGVNFSILKSTLDAEHAFGYRYAQKLLYMGIPLSVTYSVLDHERFDIYFIGGMMVEKALSAKGTIRYYDGSTPLSSTSSKLSAPGLFWSVHAGTGFGYNFIDQMGLYVEPSVNYYFPNDKQPTSYRTENHWNLDIKMGLRYNF